MGRDLEEDGEDATEDVDVAGSFGSDSSNLNGRGTVATEVVVTRVNAGNVLRRDLVQQNQTVRLHGGIAHTHAAARLSRYLSHHNGDEALLAGAVYK